MSTIQKWPLMLLICFCVIFIAACTACTTSTNIDSIPSNSSIQIPTLIESPISPFILYSGEMTLEANYPTENRFSSDDIQQAYFDFDTNKTAPLESTKNDIVFGLTTPNPDSYLVLGPSSGAKGRLEKMGQISLYPSPQEFLFNRCFANLDEYGYGGIPIPALGSYYCWLTSERRIVEFFINKIEKLPEKAGYRIEIRYVVWNFVTK
jgi:hypothetical protein